MTVLGPGVRTEVNFGLNQCSYSERIYDLVHAELSKKQRECLILKKIGVCCTTRARGRRSSAQVKLSRHGHHWRPCRDQRSHLESLSLSELVLQQSRRASTLSGVGARHRLRGGSGRSNVIGLIDGALLHDLRVSDSQCTSARDPSHHPAACVSRPDAAHLPWSDRASDSGLRLRSRPYYHGLPRRLRKRCERSFY